MGAKAARGESVGGTSGTQSIGAGGDGPVQCHLTIGGKTIDNPLLTKIGFTIEKTANSDDAVLEQGWLGSYEGLWWSGDVDTNDELERLRANDDRSALLTKRLETLERIAADRDNFGKGQVIGIEPLASKIAAFLALDTFGHPSFMDTCKQIPGFDDRDVKDRHLRNAVKDVEEQEKIEIMVKRYEVTNPDDACQTLGGANGDYITPLVMSDLAQHV